MQATRRWLGTAAFVAAAFVFSAHGAAEEDDEPLPTDPSLTKGTLPNGLSYVVRRNANPERRVTVWLHVASGSANETDAQRGGAHFLEHLAFNGSEHFAPGTLVPYFQSLGLAFGRDQNAFTNLRETTYQLALPDAGTETIGKAMLFLSDVAGRLSLVPAEIEAERQIILEEKRARGGAAERIRNFVNERIAPGSTYAARTPIGTEESIARLGPADFKEYYTHWYVPSTMTVIAAGDADPAVLVAAIRRSFGDLPRAPRPAPRPVGVTTTAGRHAIVATDPEIAGCDLSMVRVEPSRPPTLSSSQMRSDLVETLAVRAFDRRSQRLTAAGRASFLAGDASIRDVQSTLTQYRIHCRANPREWRKNLADLGTALQRARLHGFTGREVEDVRTAMLTAAEEAVDREATLPTRDVVSRINGIVAQEEPILSAAQRRDLLQRLLPGITADEVSAAFAKAFDPANAVFVIEMAAGAGPPTEKEFLGLAAAAVDVEPAEEAETERVAVVLPEPEKAGKVVETSIHKGSDVFSAWLENGVRVHHRRMTQRKNEATITITFAAGSIEETEMARGIHDAALIAWRRPAGGAYSNEQIRDFLVGRKFRTRADAGEDTLTLTVSGDPGELGDGMRLAHLLLTEPVVETRGFGGWRQSLRQGIAARKLQPAGLLTDAVDDAFYPQSEVRKRPLALDQIRRIELAAAQARIRAVASTCAMEVAVVGDIERDAAMALVTKYLGSLPARPRIGPATLAKARDIARPKGPIDVEREIDVTTPEAIVYDGFFGADAHSGEDARLLDVAARVLTTRMTKTIREERQLVYSVRASSRPAVVYPGLGIFAVQAPTDPAKGAALAAALGEMYEAFAKDGPTEDEMTVVKKQIANQLDEEMKTPAFWTGALSTLDYRGNDLDRVVGAPAAFASFKAADVRAAFAKYFRPEARFSFVVRPKVDNTSR